MTGAIPLEGADGKRVRHAHGASAEHYALCRCGHSRNKPFRSGMHWYVGFTDPAPRPSPTLFEHAGGLGPLTRAARLLHEKHIPADPLLAPVFADMAADQPQALATWLAAALGGPALPGAGEALTQSLLSPSGQPLTEDQRARWVSLASRAADEAGLPAAPGFRSAFTSCLEWLSRVATQPAADGGPGLVPTWDWGPGGPPAPAKHDAGQDTAAPVTLPAPGEPVSFDAHIKPLFRDPDRQSMRFAFDLSSADDVRTTPPAFCSASRTEPCPATARGPPTRSRSSSAGPKPEWNPSATRRERRFGRGSGASWRLFSAIMAASWRRTPARLTWPPPSRTQAQAPPGGPWSA